MAASSRLQTLLTVRPCFSSVCAISEGTFLLFLFLPLSRISFLRSLHSSAFRNAVVAKAGALISTALLSRSRSTCFAARAIISSSQSSFSSSSSQASATAPR